MKNGSLGIDDVTCDGAQHEEYSQTWRVGVLQIELAQFAGGTIIPARTAPSLKKNVFGIIPTHKRVRSFLSKPMD